MKFEYILLFWVIATHVIAHSKSRKDRTTYKQHISHYKRTHELKRHDKSHRKLNRSKIYSKNQRSRPHSHYKRHKRHLTWGVGDISGMAGGGGENGSIKAGQTEINFPPLPAEKKESITITNPPSSYPTYVNDQKKQKPIVIVPEIVYPHKVRRVMVHHDRPLNNMYQEMMYSMNPYYGHYGKNNPHYKEIAKKSEGFQSYLNSPEYKEAKSMLEKYAKVGGLGSGADALKDIGSGLFI